MKTWKNEETAREEIKSLVTAYYEQFKKPEQEREFSAGDRISYASRVYDEKEMLALTDATLDFWLTTGRFAESFEKQIAKWLGVKFAHLVNSGSSANLIAFFTLTAPELGDRQIKRGDEVITVACGFPTTVAPILQYGAVPVFVDVTIPQYNIDVGALEGALSDKTKAVMIAHTLGNPFDIHAVKSFCEKHGLWLIEDNCDALGSEYTVDGKTRYTGTWGDIGTSSFYPPHHMTMGEGGCVYTNDPLLHRLILSYRDWGRDCICPSGHDNFCGHRYDGQFGELPAGYDHKYVYSHFGYNLKVTDLQAAIGCEQLKKMPGFIERRRENWETLRELLVSNDGSIEEKIILPEAAPNSAPSWFGFMISVRPEYTEKTGIDRNAVVKYIEEHNVQTRLLFSGNLIKHPCFDEIRGTDAYRVAGSLENTDFIMNNTFWVGVYPGMTPEKLSYMAKVICEAVQHSPEKKKLAIIGASYLQLPLIEKARELGLETHVFAWAAGDVGEKAADFFYPISIVEKEQILEKCREIGIDGICSISSDLAMCAVNYVGTNLGLVCNSLLNTELSTNKRAMRKAYEAGGDPSPKCIPVSSIDDLQGISLNYPVIIKPTDRSGSRGITKLDDANGLRQAIDAAIQEGFEKKALVEEFVSGNEYSVEYISWHGKHQFLALTQKYTTGAPRYIETGHVEPAAVEPELLEKIKNVVSHALDTLHTEYGASHTEVKVTDDGKVWLIETGCRMGGDLIGSSLVEISTGIDYVKAVIDIALGNEPDLMPRHEGRAAGVRFILDESDLKDMRVLEKEHPENVLYSEIDDKISQEVTDSSNRHGYYLMAADDVNTLSALMRT